MVVGIRYPGRKGEKGARERKEPRLGLVLCCCSRGARAHPCTAFLRRALHAPPAAPRCDATRLLEAVLEQHHEQPQDELAGGVAKAPQRAQQGGPQVAASDGQGGERRQVVSTGQRVQAARCQARPRAADGALQACGRGGKEAGGWWKGRGNVGMARGQGSIVRQGGSRRTLSLAGMSRPAPSSHGAFACMLIRAICTCWTTGSA